MNLEESLKGFGIYPSDITLFHEKHGNRLYRIAHGDSHLVAKYFGESQPVEPEIYRILAKHGVPTLPIRGISDRLVLMEDLDQSPVWRKAAEDDMNSTVTGEAVAKWYMQLHETGGSVVQEPSSCFLPSEAESLSAPVILELGARLGLADNPVWKLAADHIDDIKVAMRSLPQTLNYNDFYWTNCAMARTGSRAVMFDFHLMGIGIRYSDCRNVTGSLGEKARQAFWDTYGECDEIEEILDAPTSILYCLKVAAELPKLPGWAQPAVGTVRRGELELSLRRALEVVGA